MSAENPIFISHTTADDAIVARIRKALEGQGLSVWVDSRELSGGDDLNDELFERVEQARHFMVVLSPGVINSTWVARRSTTPWITSRVARGSRGGAWLSASGDKRAKRATDLPTPSCLWQHVQEVSIAQFNREKPGLWISAARRAEEFDR